METCIDEAKNILADVEQFLGAISNEVHDSLGRERSRLLRRIVKFKEKHNNCRPKRSCDMTGSVDIPPLLPERRPTSGKGISTPPLKPGQRGKSKSDSSFCYADVPPALPERRCHTDLVNGKISVQAMPARPSCSVDNDIYEVVDVAMNLNKEASHLSDNHPVSPHVQACEELSPHPYSRQDEDLYETPVTTSSKQAMKADETYADIEINLDQKNCAPYTADKESDAMYVESRFTPKQEFNPHHTWNLLPEESLCGDATYLAMCTEESQKPKPDAVQAEPKDEAYVVMETTDGHTTARDVEVVASKHEHDSFKMEDQHSEAPKSKRKTLSDVGKKLKKRLTKHQVPVSLVHVDSITDPDHVGKLLRKKDKKIGTKWMEQTVIVKSNMIFISRMDSPGDISEYFPLSDAVIEIEKRIKQKYAFRIKPPNGKNVLFAAQTEDEMHEWIRELNKAASSVLKPILVKGLAATLDQLKLVLSDTVVSTNNHLPNFAEVLQKSERQSVSEGEDIPDEETFTEKSNEESFKRTCEQSDLSNNLKIHAIDSAQEPQCKVSEDDCDALHIAETHNNEDTVYEYDDKLVYRALKSYVATDDDELSFEVNDLILVESVDDEKWWFGTLQHKTTRQFTGETGFVPKDYIVAILSQK